MIRRTLGILTAVGILAQAASARQAAAGTQAPLEIGWDELAPLVMERKISTVLPGGVRIQGDVLAVRADSLVLDVRKSSNKKLCPKGQNEIPRASITGLGIIREANGIWRIVGGALGAIGGVYAVAGIALATESAAAVVPAVAVVIPLSAAAGHYAGKLADRRTTRISILPKAADNGNENTLVIEPVQDAAIQ
jgi:hypothetical protein